MVDQHVYQMRIILLAVPIRITLTDPTLFGDVTGDHPRASLRCRAGRDQTQVLQTRGDVITRRLRRRRLTPAALTVRQLDRLRFLTLAATTLIVRTSQVQVDPA
jgi:hypothetical protein